MLYTSFVGSVLLHIVVLTTVNTAPTHHLTIGVQGNTPTLMVTSSELGITSDTEGAHVKPMQVKARKDFKSSEKFKTSKVKSAMNYKKDKSFYFSKPSAIVTASTTTVGVLEVTTPATTIANVMVETTTPGKDVSSHATETEASPRATFSMGVQSNLHSATTTEQIMEAFMGDDNDTNKMEQTTRNGVSLPATITAKSVSSTSNPPTESMEEAASTTTSIAVEPLRRTAAESETVVVLTTEATETTEITTNIENVHADNNGNDMYKQISQRQEVALEISTATPPFTSSSLYQQSTAENAEQIFTTSEDIATIDGTKVLSELNTRQETTTTQQPFSSQESSHTEITSTQQPLSGQESSHMEITSTQQAWTEKESTPTETTSTQQSWTTSQESSHTETTPTQQHWSSQVSAHTEITSTRQPWSSQEFSNAQTTSTQQNWSRGEKSHSESVAVSEGLTSTSTEPILKLIDLERHVSLSPDGREHDNGHDGLKNIKKKQLIDKHYLDVVSHKKPEDGAKDQVAPSKVEVKHGFLGPIMMAERTFHITSAHNTTDHTNRSDQNQQKFETQLRRGNFVEIKSNQEKETDESTTVVPTAETTSTQFPLKERTVQANEVEHGPSTVLSTTVFQVADTVATKVPTKAANTMFTSTDGEEVASRDEGNEKMESKISDIQIEVYDSTVDSIVASTNFKDADVPPGKSTKPPLGVTQQERFTQYVIDRTETSTQESINFSTIQVASGKPEPAAIEIHINVSESFSNDSEDLDVSFPQTDYNNNGRGDDTSYDDDIKLKIPSNTGNGAANKERSDEVLVVEIVDGVDNATESKGKPSNSDDLFVTDVKEALVTPPPPPPPPPFQPNFDRDSDTIFYISNTEVKVGETLPTPQKSFMEERKLKLENQFFPANYVASTHPNVNSANAADEPSEHHLYEEDIILSSNRNQADSLKIYRNRNEPSPPLDVTYVGESIIEVEQSPDSSMATSFSSEHMITPQPDVIIQPAILPEISIGVPVIGELPPQIELKEIDFMPSEAQLHRSGVYGHGANEDGGNSNAISNAINSVGGNNDVDNRLDDSSIQYGGDLIDESADGGFDGVEGSYPFGNPATMTKAHKQNHLSDYAHLYINYGVNNMRKDELTADVKDSGEVAVILERNAGVAGNGNEGNVTFKDFLNKVVFNNSSSAVGMNESERISNVTAFSIMEDSSDLEDKNTEDIINLISLAIGLFIVILPVVVTCSMLWALRYLYKKYHSNSTDNNGNLDPAETKNQPNEDAAEKGESMPESTSPSPTSDKEEIQKCPDSFANPSADISVVKFVATAEASQLDSSLDSHCKVLSCSPKARDLPLSLALQTMPSETQSVHDEIAQGPNGSITKMTLENNLLIVETEERNDMSRVARETKMDYNKDGVFVVEVSRGIDSKTIPDSPVTEGADKMLSMFEPKHNGTVVGYKLANEKVSHNNEKVQIHSPPPEKTEDGPRSLHQIEEVDEPVHSPRLQDGVGDEINGMAYKSNTGLSQSDLSSTSSNDSNKDYCYGNQELYVVEQAGYCTSSPTGQIALKCDSKDIKDDDRNSENGRHLENSPGRRENPKESEDVLDTINREKEGETCDEQNVEQEQKEEENENENENENETKVVEQEQKEEENENENENETKVEANQTEVSTVEVDVMPPDIAAVVCNGHAESTYATDLEQSGDRTSGDAPTNGHPEKTAPVSPQTQSSTNTSSQTHLNEEPGIAAANETLSNDILENTNSLCNTTVDVTNKSAPLINGSDILPDLVPATVIQPSHTNGEVVIAETPLNSNSEFENGYDSIISLPEPPPTSDEILCSDLSEQQLDSLPPPPPPLVNELNGEAFTLKDLPPPLANSGSESLPHEDANNVYASLPPPPPTTLHVSSTPTINGNMHASPLTPPASPPPHFTNGLHTALCPPIAVDVNGS